ncbi:MAG: hypothetical protein QM754_18135 [Tepidisphaeraceae bacterium]
MRLLTRLSLILLIATLNYWLFARLYAADLRSLGGNNPKFPTASFVLGSHEYAWVTGQGFATVAVTSNPGGDALPLLGRLPVMTVLLGSPPGLKWTSGIEPTPFFGGGYVTVRGQTDSGRPIVFRLFYVRLWLLLALFAVLPMIAVFRITLSRLRHARRARRVRRVRRARLRLGRCVCGYDLRSSRRKCPECGRAVRWMPVSLPTLSRKG